MTFLSRMTPHAVAAVLLLAVTLGALNGGAMAAIGLGGAVLLYGSAAGVERRWLALDRTWVGFAAVFLLWGGVTAVTAAEPARAVAMAVQMGTVLLPLCLLSALRGIAAVAAWARFLPLGIAAAALVMLMEFLGDAPLLQLLFHKDATHLYAYNRGESYLTVLMWPVVGAMWCGGWSALWGIPAASLSAKKEKIWHSPVSTAWISGQKWQTFVVLALLTAMAVFGIARGAKLALAGGLLTALLGARWPRVTAGVAFAALAGISLAMPVIVPWVFEAHPDWVRWLPPSWQHRFEIWDYVAARIFERPWLGWGLDASSRLSIATAHTAQYVYALGPASHPHHAAVQLWVETGLCGLVLGLAFAGFVLWRIVAMGNAVRPFALAAWVAGVTLCFGAFNLWSDSLWGTFAVTWLGFQVLRRREG